VGIDLSAVYFHGRDFIGFEVVIKTINKKTYYGKFCKPYCKLFCGLYCFGGLQGENKYLREFGLLASSRFLAGNWQGVIC
jgi:hypothetical protein